MWVHHSAICTADVDTSLRFWRDGLGFAEIFDLEFEGDWPTLFGAASTRLRSVFLGDPANADAGIVELVEFDNLGAAGAPEGSPRSGFFLLSVFTDLDAALGRLAGLGLGGRPVEVTTLGTRMAVVRDPNGVLVELIDAPAATKLGLLSR